MRSWWLVVLAGCIDVKPFHGDAGAPLGDGSFDSVLVLPDVPPNCPTTSAGSNLGFPVSDLEVKPNGSFGQLARATDASWAIQFNSGAAHFPVSYKLNGTELLAANVLCQIGSFTGVDLVPGGRSDSGSAGGATIETLLAGPSIGRVKITWNASVDCFSAQVVSMWTFFPDGRTTRQDTVSNLTNVVSTDCACGSGANVAVVGSAESLYLHEAFDAVALSSGSSLAPSGNPQALTPISCLTGAASSTLIRAVAGGTTSRLLSTSASTDVDIFDDFFSSHNAAGTGTSSYIPAPKGVTCPLASSLVATFATPPQVFVDGAQTSAPMTDGIYGELRADAGVDVQDTSTLTVPSGPPAPPGFAIALHYAGTRTHFAIFRNGNQLDPAHARVQAFDDTHAALWLRDSFGGDAAACDRITIVATP